MQHLNFLLSAGIRLFEILFAVGILGSLLVIILTAVEDVRTVLGKEHQDIGETAWPPRL